MTGQKTQSISTLGMREQYRDRYWRERDPIYEDRLLWRAQTFRHMVHLLPNQTILELGAGQGLFTRQLLRISRGENPITAVTFNSEKSRPDDLPHTLEFLNTESLPGILANRRFDHIVAMDLLDKSNCARVSQIVYELLKPSGQVIFYESNPWNVVLRFRQHLSKYFGTKDPRRLLSRPELYDLISEIGFISVFAVYNDFVYAPLTRTLIWLLRNLSILLENAPRIQTLAGTILIHAQKPPRIVDRPKVSLCEHEQFNSAVSVVIPCYNEEMNIGPLITGIKDFFGEYIHEIIPVDDNSQDSTSDVLRRLADKDPIIKPVFRSSPNGVGRAIADGYRAATGRYLLSMDCDFQHILPEIRDLFDAAAEGYDVVVGSRFSRHSVLLNYPFQKIIANRGFHVLAQIMLLRHFRDLTNNLKLMRREVVEALTLTQPGFAVNAEVGLQPLLMGYTVKEVPVSWINRTPDMGVSSFKLIKVGGGYWQVLFRLWCKTIFGFRRLPQNENTSLCRQVALRANIVGGEGDTKEQLVKSSQICREGAAAQKPAKYSSEAVMVVRSDRVAKSFVWSVWFVMMLVALVCLAKFGRNIPLTEDWLLVPPLTGNEPNLANWLWAQNNEHRIPLPRLIMLILLKVTRGDFRAGMLFDIFSLGILALFMIRIATQLRGGRTIFADAFFPIVLLHLGNWENLFWSWQLSFVVPTVLICLLILVLVSNRILVTRRASLIGGICLVLLPLCGAPGLLFVPFLALWFCYSGALHWYATKTHAGKQWVGGLLVSSAAVALCLSGLYFIGYERPSWTPPRLGLSASLQAAIQFLTLGFGPVARSSRMLSIIAGVGFLLSGVFIIVRAVIRHKGQEKHRAMSILVVFGSFVVFAIAMGWGRGAVVSIWGYWPIRYVILAMPTLCIVFFAWELYGPTKLRTVVQTGLFLVMCVLIPFNTIHGIWWRNWYVAGMNSVEKDLMAGTLSSALAERHRNFLFHSIEPRKLEDLMRMLHERGIGPFALMRGKRIKSENRISNSTSTQAQGLVTQEIRYHMPEAGEVFFVWGIDGWNAVLEEIRPNGTVVKNNVMHTPMVRDRETFITKLQVPLNAKIEYGFLITKDHRGDDIIKNVWDGNKNYRKVVSENGVIDVKTMLRLGHNHNLVPVVEAPLITQRIRYHMPEADEVFFVWGIDGWNTVVEEIRPSGTMVKNNVMHTPMVRDDETFVAKVQVPPGKILDYGFLITEKRGIFDLAVPVWDGDKDYHRLVSENGFLEVKSKLTLPDDLSSVLDKSRYFLIGIGVLSVTWLSFFIILRLLAGEKKEYFRNGS